MKVLKKIVDIEIIQWPNLISVVSIIAFNTSIIAFNTNITKLYARYTNLLFSDEYNIQIGDQCNDYYMGKLNKILFNVMSQSIWEISTTKELSVFWVNWQRR